MFTFLRQLSFALLLITVAVYGVAVVVVIAALAFFTLVVDLMINWRGRRRLYIEDWD